MAEGPAAILNSLSNKPGVYRMLDEDGAVIYVGKARSLRKRVASYFGERAQLSAKTRALIAHTARVEVTVTHTETEALLLENNLIKELNPRYNVLLRDDKSFPYIYLSTDEEFPRLAFHRGPRRGGGRYFGPYPSAGATRETLNLLQKLFRIRQCENTFFGHRSRPCLQYQIKRCTAPCVGLASAESYAEDVRHATMFLDGKSDEMIEELVVRMQRASEALEFERAARYRDQINSVRRVQERQYISGARGDVDVIAVESRDGLAVVQVFFIRGGQSIGSRSYFPRNAAGMGNPDVLEAFLPQYYLFGPAERRVPAEIVMSEALEHTEALREVLSEKSGRSVTFSHRVRGDRVRWLRMARSNASVALTQQLMDRSNIHSRIVSLHELLELEEEPRRIECFDVSHTQGEATVASCVVFDSNGPLKSDYRRFNIVDVQAGDDFSAIRQAVSRRYTRVRKEDGKLPDLLLIDGGKAQLGVAAKVLEELQLDGICVAAVSKGASRKAGLEQLHLVGRAAPIHLPPDAPGLHLIQQIRDEAHRFAITGHRQRRHRARLQSPLEQVPGIGAKRRQRLLTEFGGLQGVARAGVDDLRRVKGISYELAQAIYDRFHDQP